MESEDLQKLVTFATPYGKYKGRVIADLPGYYLNWFAREGFPNGELGRLLAWRIQLRSAIPAITQPGVNYLQKIGDAALS